MQKPKKVSSLFLTMSQEYVTMNYSGHHPIKFGDYLNHGKTQRKIAARFVWQIRLRPALLRIVRSVYLPVLMQCPASLAAVFAPDDSRSGVDDFSYAVTELCRAPKRKRNFS